MQIMNKINIHLIYSFKVTIKEKRNNLKTKFILNYLKSKFSHYVCTFFMAIHIFIIINYL